MPSTFASSLSTSATRRSRRLFEALFRAFAADRVELPVRRRVIPDRPHRDDADLRAALAAAEWETLPAAAVRT